MATAAAETANKPSVETSLSDKEFVRCLLNEDICCPICYRPYIPAKHELQAGEGYVNPVVLHCNHAVCEECARLCYEPFVQFVKHGVRCPYHKRDQMGNPPYVCQFVSPKTVDDLMKEKGELEAKLEEMKKIENPDENKQKEMRNLKLDILMKAENTILAHVLRDETEVLLGTSNPRFNAEEYKKIQPLTEDDVKKCEGDAKKIQELYKKKQEELMEFSKSAEFYYWFKYCRKCQAESNFVCEKCKLAFCEKCWADHMKSTEGHDEKKEEEFKLTVEDYEKNKIQKHKCSVCNNRAFKYCGVCEKYYCRNRKDCYDHCVDPDHVLVDFDPSVIELKRTEATAMDNTRKMFIHDVHDYLEANPFLWQAADMESLYRTMWYIANVDYKKAKMEKKKKEKEADKSN